MNCAPPGYTHRVQADGTPEPRDAAAHDARAASADLATAISSVYREALGKGPARARGFIHGDVAVVVLEDIYTTGERTLIEAGAADDVIATRARMQRVVGDRFVAAAENVLRRSVRAFLSQNHTDPDVSVEVFLLSR
jgi:uncharacterized protein YbcI